MMADTEPARLKIVRALQLGRALHFVWQSAKGWTVASRAILLVQGVLPLLPLYLMKLIVDAATAGVAAPDKGDWRGSMKTTCSYPT